MMAACESFLSAIFSTESLLSHASRTCQLNTQKIKEAARSTQDCSKAGDAQNEKSGDLQDKEVSSQNSNNHDSVEKIDNPPYSNIDMECTSDETCLKAVESDISTDAEVDNVTTRKAKPNDQNKADDREDKSAPRIFSFFSPVADTGEEQMICEVGESSKMDRAKRQERGPEGVSEVGKSTKVVRLKRKEKEPEPIGEVGESSKMDRVNRQEREPETISGVGESSTMGHVMRRNRESEIISEVGESSVMGHAKKRREREPETISEVGESSTMGHVKRREGEPETISEIGKSSTMGHVKRRERESKTISEVGESSTMDLVKHRDRESEIISEVGESSTMGSIEPPGEESSKRDETSGDKPHSRTSGRRQIASTDEEVSENSDSESFRVFSTLKGTTKTKRRVEWSKKEEEVRFISFSILQFF